MQLNKLLNTNKASSSHHCNGWVIHPKVSNRIISWGNEDVHLGTKGKNIDTAKANEANEN